MKIENKGDVAVVRFDGVHLKDVGSALDIIGNAGKDKIVLFKENISEDCFKLSTGILGEILQKFVTYGIRVAIVGDFGGYTSKPLKDFIYESNNGHHVFFVSTEEAALEKLDKI